jgi:hypothetical protein
MNLGTVKGEIEVKKETINYLSIAAIITACTIISFYFLIKKLVK